MNNYSKTGYIGVPNNDLDYKINSDMEEDIGVPCDTTIPPYEPPSTPTVNNVPATSDMFGYPSGNGFIFTFHAIKTIPPIKSIQFQDDALIIEQQNNKFEEKIIFE